MTQNKTLIFKKVPTGLPVAGEHLAVEDRPIDLNEAAPAGGVVVEILYASYDPYLRGKMRPAGTKSYSPPFDIDGPIINDTLGKVIKSDNPDFEEGSYIKAYLPISEYARIPKDLLEQVRARKIQNPHGLDLGLFLGPLGMPGLTAWSGLHQIGQPQKGETIFISSAAGAVGQIVGQVAKREGLKVIGSVGSDEKLDFIVNELGFDGGFNYKKENPKDALPRLAPNGIDIYFENVGGDHLEAALNSMNVGGRVPVCGMIGNYNIPADQQEGIKGLMQLVTKQITMQGFLVGSPKFGPAHYKEHQESLQKWLADGSVKAKLSVTEGIDNAADGFIGMLEGKNFGKAVLKPQPRESDRRSKLSNVPVLAWRAQLLKDWQLTAMLLEHSNTQKMALAQSEGRGPPSTTGDSDWQKELMLLEEQYKKRGVVIRSEQLKACSTAAIDAICIRQRMMREEQSKKREKDRSESGVFKTERDASQSLGLVLDGHGEGVDSVESPTKRRDTRDTPPRSMPPQAEVSAHQASEPGQTGTHQHQRPDEAKESNLTELSNQGNSPAPPQDDGQPATNPNAGFEDKTLHVPPESPQVKEEPRQHGSEEPQEDQRINANHHVPQVSPDSQGIHAAPTEAPQQHDEMQLDEDLVLPSITTPEDSREWNFFAAAPDQTFDNQALDGHSTAPMRTDYGDLSLLLNPPDSPLHLFNPDMSPRMISPQPMFDPVRSCDDLRPMDAYERKPDVVSLAELDQRLLAENKSARSDPLYKATLKRDGLYHCPWEGKDSCNHKPSKLKCHFDKFVDSHLKPYKCTVSTCPSGPFSSTACLLRHEREAHALHGHGDKPFLCPHEGCERAIEGNGFPRRWNLLDHVRRIHKMDGSRVRSRGGVAQRAGLKRRRSAAKGASRETTSELEELKADWEMELAAVKDILGRLGGPENPESGQLIQDAQAHLSAMSALQLKISALK
ncbi:hypothetical protein ACJZ2D_013994 [Fusarium nematophilum]